MKRDQLLLYYERELQFIRSLAGEFAQKYPEIAGRLLLEPTKCEDPHVERLIEAVSMLTARIQLRLDDDFPEVSEALLDLLYPHYLAPVPSMTIVELALDPEQGRASEGLRIERHALLRARPVGDVRCRFRTAYPVELWPLRVERAELLPATELGSGLGRIAQSALRLRLRSTTEEPISKLPLRQLRFYLEAGSGVVHSLYELFARRPVGLFLRKGAEGTPRVLGAEHIRPVGFEKDEGILDYGPESFLGYRLLQEYFAFPEKFLFVDLCGLDLAPGAEDFESIDLAVLHEEPLTPDAIQVGPENFRLGCTPAINLFPQAIDPIRLHHTSVEYPVVPDVRAAESYEVYRVTEVTATKAGNAEPFHFRPFYALRHGSQLGADVGFWHSARRPSLRRDDPGTDVWLRIVDGTFDPYAPPSDVLNVKALCTNRDLASRLQVGDPQGDFEIQGQPEVRQVTCLTKPTRTQRLTLAGDTRWRLVSQLALNYLSLARVDDGEDPEAPLHALREILRLHEFSEGPVNRRRIEGLTGLRSRTQLRRIRTEEGPGFARGIEIRLDFDEEKYTGSGLFLFASVLERFLALYATVNSFTQTVAVSRQRGSLKKWAPRAGEIQLL